MSDESERANKPKQNRFLQYIGRRAFAGELLTFFGALLLGRVCIAGDIAPFGLAFLAAARFPAATRTMRLPARFLAPFCCRPNRSIRPYARACSIM